MKKESVLYGVIGLLFGVIIAAFATTYAVNNSHDGMMRDMMDMHSGSSMSMNDMVTALENKSGDAFDEAFISEMIDHHQGAIDMANLAKQNAKHDEIKNLADDIINAQTKEIDQMKSWQKQWGYNVVSSRSGSGQNPNMSDGMMNMNH